jgi:DNA-binding NtrC family response regulator
VRSIPETLIENELFGHERGAFTGADRTRPGKLELASGGTLFLDEIANLPLAMQAKLLRVLQEKRCYRIAGTAAISVDVRVVAATNQPLNVFSPASTFRADLYHRLGEYVIQVPALRDRKDDIPFLAHRFLEATNDELGKQVQGFSPAAVDLLMTYGWPGNVRELRNWVRRAVLVADEMVEPIHLPATTAGVPPADEVAAPEADQVPLKELLRQQTEAVERRVLRQALEAAKGNKAKAARLLEIDYKTLYTKLKKHGLASG